MLKYLVAYASETGNTKMIAEEIYNAIPTDSKKLINVRQWNGDLKAQTYFIGYWVNRNTCSLEVIDFISSLHNKNVAFFGTCGLGNTESYYKKIENIGLTWLSSDNRFLGSYFCQGKMPVEIRQKYESCRGLCDKELLDKMIENYEEAKAHPNRQDLLRANVFTSDIIAKLS